MFRIKKIWEKKTCRSLLEKFIVFLKAQLSAMIGGVFDYLIMIFFTEVFHVYYPISIAIGGAIGAVINFSLNKTWTFRTKNLPYKNTVRKQLLKFVLVVINSIALKSSGTYLLTTYLHIDYKISRIIVDLIVSVLFNYNLQKYWVFKKVNPKRV